MTNERREQIRAMLARFNPGYGFTHYESRQLFSAACELQAAYDVAAKMLEDAKAPIREELERMASALGDVERFGLDGVKEGGR